MLSIPAALPVFKLLMAFRIPVFVILLVLIFSGGPASNSGGSTDGGRFGISLKWSSKFYSIYVLDWCIYGGCVPTKLSCYVIECFNVSCTACRLAPSKLFHIHCIPFLSCLQIFFTPLSSTQFCSSAYFFWCLVVALKSFSFISRLCSTFCQVFLALWLQIAYSFLM